MLLIANVKQNCLHNRPKLNRVYELQIKCVKLEIFACSGYSFSSIQSRRARPLSKVTSHSNLRCGGESPLIELTLSE